jgi:SAM-dependent methyltransferase
MRKLRNQQIYVEAPLRGLQDAQLRALLPDLQRCTGTHALLVTTTGGKPPPALPLLACWTELCVDDARYSGDLFAAADEPLPFVDDAFDVVWLRHALEVVPQPASVLRETVRVLAPGGTLVIGGVHPFSAWAPWFYWATRGAGRELHSPIKLMHALRCAGLDVISTRRVGHLWPMAGKYGPRDRAPWGGGYVLLARKQHCLVTPLRVVHAPPLRMPASSFSPSARRGTTA